jgi:hypothetical protein
VNDLDFRQLQDELQDVPNSANTFFIGNNADGAATLLLDVSKLLGQLHNSQNPPALELEEVCVFIWKLLNLAYQAQEQYNSTKAPEAPFIRAFVRPIVTVESTQAEIPIGIGRGVVNVRVPYIPQTIDPQIEVI